MLYFKVLRDSETIGHGQIEPPFQIGRQNKDEIDLRPICVSTRGELRRLIVVGIADVSMPRQAVNISLDNGKIAVASLVSSDQCRLYVRPHEGHLDHSHVQADEEVTLAFSNGISIQIKATEPKIASDECLSLTQLRTVNPDEPKEQSLLDLSPNVQAKAVNLIKASLQLTNEIPGTPKFFNAVVATVRDLIDVDRVTILRRDGDDWIVSSDFGEAPGQPIRISRSLVKRVLESRETQIFEPSENLEVSIKDVQRAVASPIFDEAGAVLAILYADKPLGMRDRPISHLQASLLDIVASAISNSMLRQRDAEFRTTTGQFFSKSVLDRLSNHKDLLEGQDLDVSILFCDIRGFSSVAQQALPSATILWINDVLTSLSECILEEDGVVVDYIGDAVMAMFGAPEPQSDHADRACRAALAMLSRIPELTAQHQKVTSEFELGIGVNSGEARVGNTGSRIKFKYGPLGNTVNLASRVEGITKKFGVSCLLTGSTKSKLSQTFLTRRLSRIRVVGIADAVDVHQLMPETNQELNQLCAEYSQALELFEKQKFPEAIAQFANVIKQWPEDKPSRLMLGRCVDAMNSTQPFDPIFNMLEK